MISNTFNSDNSIIRFMKAQHSQIMTAMTGII